MTWAPLREQFGSDLVDLVRARLLDGSSPQIDKRPFEERGHASKTIDALFGAMVVAGILEMREVLRCPECKQELDADVAEYGVCPRCEHDMGESGDTPVIDVIHLVRGDVSREIPWLIAVHGFNTHGEWQEEFAWLLATRFRHRAPSLMFKFPFLFLGLLFKRRHLALAADLDRKVRQAISRAKEAGINDPPDIVAHSFGTLLLVTLLDRPESTDLRFGRVILAGSIIPLEYDWSRHHRDKRFEAILNHCSKRDTVVDLAQWAVPDAGPSGRVGFYDESVLNYLESGFGHGTHFEADTMISLLRHGGLWDRFLRLPPSSVREVITDHRPTRDRWRPWRGLVMVTGAVAKVFGLLVVAPVMVVVGGVKFVIKGTLG